MINSTKVSSIKTTTPNKIFAFSITLLLAMTMLMAAAQPGLAQVGMTNPRPTQGFMSVAPELVGVDQEATVNLWIAPIPNTYAAAPYFQGYNGITVTFVKPDGSEDSFMPVDGTGQFDPGQTEATGNIYFYYAPDIAGNWSVSFTMPEQNITDSSGTVIYEACTSNTAYFRVQTDPVDAGLLNGWPWSPLPNENVFWSYPINSNNREWSQISGDWLVNGIARFTSVFGTTSNSWQPYGTAPNTAHVVWRNQLGTGGLVGGEYGSISYVTVVYQGAVITSGRAFINVPSNSVGGGGTISKFKCVDLATGDDLFVADGQISCGWHIPGNPYSQSYMDPSVVLGSSYGSTPATYLFGATYYPAAWNLYDSSTGTLMRSIANVSAAAYKLVDGTNLAYGITSDRQNLFGWDLSKVASNNWPTGIVWTSPIVQQGISPSILGLSADASTLVLTGASVGNNQYFGYSTEDGSSRWNLTLPYNAGGAFSMYGANADYFVVYDSVNVKFHCYSKTNGHLVWSSPSFEDSPWASEYTVYNSETNDDDNLYIMAPDGIMRALSLETGELVWESEPFPSTEFTNNVVPYYIGIALMGGNVYAYAGYSVGYQLDPIPRTAMMVCINATTGDTTWTLNGGVWVVSAANGYVVGWGMNDGYVYCVGKGKTATSVTAPLTVVPLGDEVLIQGFVKDMSPGAPDTPAVSDEDMSEWMDYLYMQNATLLNNPPLPDGVTVTLSVVDPNNNCYEIGTVTSDSSGLYKLTWTPEIEGEYTVYAQFDGSASYYSSYATTALSVSKPVATATPEPTQTAPDNTALLYGILVAVIIAIVIGLLALFRKR